MILLQLTECIKQGKKQLIKPLLSNAVKRYSLHDIVMALDQGIDLLTREWYLQYDWNGKARHPNPPLSYRDFEEAWNAYEVAHQYIQNLPAISSRFNQQQQIIVGTGTLGNVHKAILRIDLHLRLKGWTVVFLGTDLRPEDVLSRHDDVDALVLSTMAHSSKVPALNMLKEVTERWTKPLFVGGSALKAIDAWFKDETNHVPYFVKEHSIEKKNYKDVKAFTRSYFQNARYVESISELQELLTVIIPS